MFTEHAFSNHIHFRLQGRCWRSAAGDGARGAERGTLPHDFSANSMMSGASFDGLYRVSLTASSYRPRGRSIRDSAARRCS